MRQKVYKVDCTMCKGSSKLNINKSNRVEYIDQTPIISSRFRKDLHWGFECLCGNDNRLCREELSEVDNQVPVKGSSKEVVDAVIDRMKLSTDDSFIMTEL